MILDNLCLYPCFCICDIPCSQVNGEIYTQICSSEEGECCVSPLLGVDSSPEISTDVDNEDNIINNEKVERDDDENCSSDSDTGLIKLW